MAFTRYDIFLSYSRADSGRVRPLRDELQRLGYRVFFDMESIEPGSHWKERLRRAIRSSRTLVLCWSQAARQSEYITFEFSQAQANGKPVFPWLLDTTPLPVLLELQGISELDGLRAAEILRPYLGTRLVIRRRYAASVLACIILAATSETWRFFHPPTPPPWMFTGRVFDRETRQGIIHAEVDIEIGDRKYIARTGHSGEYSVALPQPRPRTVTVEYMADGYRGDKTYSLTTDHPDSMDLVRLADPASPCEPIRSP